MVDICDIIESGALGKGWALRSINGKPLLHIAESFYQSTLCGQWAKTVELPANQGRICKCCELAARTRYREWTKAVQWANGDSILVKEYYDSRAT